MAKLEKQYKGARGSSVNLPNLSVSTAKPLGAGNWRSSIRCHDSEHR
jgi:hypothetical protein